MVPKCCSVSLCEFKQFQNFLENANLEMTHGPEERVCGGAPDCQNNRLLFEENCAACVFVAVRLKLILSFFSLSLELIH